MTNHAPNLIDVEALVYGLLKDLGGISVFAYDAQAGWPFVSESVAVQVDVRASSKKRARDRAYSARQLILRLPFSVTHVTNVQIVAGPSWFPEEDGAPRYVIRTAVATRALAAS